MKYSCAKTTVSVGHSFFLALATPKNTPKTENKICVYPKQPSEQNYLPCSKVFVSKKYTENREQNLC